MTAGFAHVSCLAEQAKILVADADERNLDDGKWERWGNCSLCEQGYHGTVSCALGWACWKTYVSGEDLARKWFLGAAMTPLGRGLYDADHYEDSLSVLEAKLSLARRLGGSDTLILVTKSNMARCYNKLGRHEEALAIARNAYDVNVERYGESQPETIPPTLSLALALVKTGKRIEAKEFLRECLPIVDRALGRENVMTLRLRWLYSNCLGDNDDATIDDTAESVAMLESVATSWKRVMGERNEELQFIMDALRKMQSIMDALRNAIGNLGLRRAADSA